MGSKKSSSQQGGKADVNASILELLRDGPLSTKRIAAALGVQHTTVYSRCRADDSRTAASSHRS